MKSGIVIKQEAPISKKIETTAIIHDALNGFDFVHGSLNQSIAIIGSDGVHYGIDALFQKRHLLIQDTSLNRVHQKMSLF